MVDATNCSEPTQHGRFLVQDSKVTTSDGSISGGQAMHNQGSKNIAFSCQSSMHDDISLSPQMRVVGGNNVHFGNAHSNNINVGANSNQAGSSSPRDFMYRQGRSGDSQQEAGVNLDLPSQSSTSRFRATSSTHTMAKIQAYGVG